MAGAIFQRLLSNKAGSTLTPVSQGAGTAIGNMTLNGGLAAAFDGTTSQTGTNSSAANSVSQGYVGKDWGSGVTKSMGQAVVYASSNSGYDEDGAGPSITLYLQGSNDNFVSDINDLGGSQVAASPYTASNGISKTITPTVLTAYRYHRIKMEATSGSGTLYPRIAEVQFSEYV